MPTHVAALFVDPRGGYAGLSDVETWDEARDARLYPGPWPVVAHPPCARWCQLAHIVQKRYGYKVGDDEGCFETALAAVKQWGGVLEHPASSLAWTAFDLPNPRPSGWTRGICGGWVCEVEQGHYGHPARKKTWLYAFRAQYLPAFRWGPSVAGASVSFCKNHGGSGPRISKKAASATPPAFRDLLLDTARSVR